MPKGAKKRAKLKKKQQGGHPAGSDAGGNDNNNHTNNEEGSNNSSGHGHRDAASDGSHLPIQLNIPPVDASEDSMESSEEMVTPRAGADEEDKKGAASEVPVEVVDAGEEVMVDALPPEAGEREQEGKGDSTAEAHAALQEPEVQDVVVSEAPEVLEPEAVVRETASKAHPVRQPEAEAVEVVVREAATSSVVQEPEAKGEVSRSREADGAQTTEVARGPAVAVAVAAPQHRAKWWDCCGVFDAVAGSER